MEQTLVGAIILLTYLRVSDRKGSSESSKTESDPTELRPTKKKDPVFGFVNRTLYCTPLNS